MSKKLAICIPTYNRETYLEECLSSIIKQIIDNGLQNDVQICVSDNCSSDNTMLLVQNIIRTSNINIILHQNDYNIGADLNFLKCIEIANAEYCWFMGSDDVLADNCLNTVLNEIRTGMYSVHLFNRIECDVNMKFKKKSDWFSHRTDNFSLFEEKGCLDYFNSCNSIGAVFSYLSTIIFKKTDWDAVPFDNSYIGTAYPHVYILLNVLMIKKNCLKISKNIYPVLCRDGNDSFSEDGVIKRFEIDIYGYEKLGLDLFGRNYKVQSAFWGIMSRTHRIRRIFTMRNNLPLEKWEILKLKLKKFKFNKYALNFLSAVSDKNFSKIYSFLEKVIS